MPNQDPHEWWAERCAHIAELMKNTGVGELVIRRTADGKYSFEITPESDVGGYRCEFCGEKPLTKSEREFLHNADVDARRAGVRNQTGG